ncbi:MAG: hypothetical protein IPM16_00155 [Chloroflexi bacterium]|nr:hypothetical protein [Chloroflexota bacterium]
MRLETTIGMLPNASRIKWSSDSQKVAISTVTGGIAFYSRDFLLLGFLQGYIEGVRSMAWSLDNNSLVFSQVMTTDRTDSAVVEQRVVLWDLARNEPTLLFYSHPDTFASAVVWSQDGTKLAAALADDEILVWDATTGDELLRLTGQHIQYAMDLRWIGERHLASFGYDNTVRIWSVEGKENPYEPEAPEFSGVIHFDVAAEQGLLLYVTEDGRVRLWDVINNAPIQTPEFDDDGIRFACWMADRNHIVGVNQQGVVTAWHATTGVTRAALASPCHVLVVHPHLSRVAVANKDGSVVLWDVVSNHVQQVLPSGSQSIRSLNWSPDGTRLLGSMEGNGIWLWDTTAGAETVVQPEDSLTRLEGLSSVSRHTSRGLLLLGFEFGRYVILEADGRTFQVRSLAHREPLSTAKWSNNGERYAVGGYYGSIDVFATDSNVALMSIKFEGTLHGLDWSPDDSKIVGFLHSSAAPSCAVMISASTGEVVKFETTAFMGAWSADSSMFASISMSRETIGSLTLQISGTDGSSIAQHLPPSLQIVSTMKWQPNKRRICFGTHDGRLHIWDTEKESLITEIAGHSSSVSAIAWHPDLPVFASGGRDHKVAVWNVGNQEQLLGFFHPSQITALQWSPDGSSLIVGSIDGTVTVWLA